MMVPWDLGFVEFAARTHVNESSVRRTIVSVLCCAVQCRGNTVQCVVWTSWFGAISHFSVCQL
jgi:hypothetical protein